MNRDERRHPERVADDPAECDAAPGPTASHRARVLGGLRAAAVLTPEQRSERSRRAAEARWTKDAAEREAAGLPARRRRAPEPSAEELEPWLDEVDRLYPTRQWPNREARRREAIILARTSAARVAMEAMKHRGDA